MDFAARCSCTRAALQRMKAFPKNPETLRIVWSLVWACAIIAAAFLLKGNVFLYWIEAGLMVGALAFVVLRPRRPVCLR